MKYFLNYLCTALSFLILHSFCSASEKNADWISHYVFAQESIGIQDDTAIEEYSEAIALKPDEPFLYVQRGQLFAKKQMWEEASKDFTHVIEFPNVHVSTLLHALYGRARALFMLDEMKEYADKTHVEQIALDYSRANQIDASKIYCFGNEKYAIEWNISEGDIHNKEFKKAYAESSVTSNECESINDIYFYDNWTVIKKLKTISDRMTVEKHKEMDWIDYYVLAQEAVGRKDGNGAINAFNKAIDLHPGEPILYVQRGQIFDKKHMWEEAEKDFTYVIDFPNLDPSILLHALYGRIRARLRMIGVREYIFANEPHDEITLDLAEASAIDTSEISAFENETYSIQWNVAKEKIQNQLFISEYTNFMIGYDKCDSPEDIHFYDNQTIIKKLKKKEKYQTCKQRTIEKKSIHLCAGCGDHLKDVFAQGEQKNQNCY